MPDVDRADLIPIAEAAGEFERSRKWLDQQIELRKLSTVSIPGDRKLYLLRSEIAALLEPQITQHRAEDAG